MASLSLPTPVDGQPAVKPTTSTENEVVLVAGLRNPIAAEYAAFVSLHGGRATLAGTEGSQHLSSLVLFLSPQLTAGDRRALDDLLGKLAGKKLDSVCVVSSFRIHFGDRNAAATEAHVLDRVKTLGARTVVVRAGHVLTPQSRTTSWLRQLGGFGALVPARLRSCFVRGAELFA